MKCIETRMTSYTKLMSVKDMEIHKFGRVCLDTKNCHKRLHSLQSE